MQEFYNPDGEFVVSDEEFDQFCAKAAKSPIPVSAIHVIESTLAKAPHDFSVDGEEVAANPRLSAARLFERWFPLPDASYAILYTTTTAWAKAYLIAKAESERTIAAEDAYIKAFLEAKQAMRKALASGLDPQLITAQDHSINDGYQELQSLSGISSGKMDLVKKKTVTHVSGLVSLERSAEIQGGPLKPRRLVGIRNYLDGYFANPENIARFEKL